MEKGAKREGVTPQMIADKYISEFETDVAALNVMQPTFNPKATEYVQQMIEFTQILVDKGFAYATPSAIYFDTTKAKDYTKLSGQKLEEQEVGAGHGDVEDQEKLHPADFALWFFKTGKHANAIQTWPSPFGSAAVANGEGFPGWHIECSAMAKETLGGTIDFHLGGVEHIPVHHTNEIAQSESANGQKFANYWLHYEHLNIDGAKMSKSDGNVYNLAQIVDRGYDPLALRYFFLQAHYRSKQNFTWDALEASATAYSRLVAKLQELKVGEGKDEVNDSYRQKFTASLEDDFNVPAALALVWEVIKDPEISDQSTLATILDFDRVLGLQLDEKMSMVEEIELTDEAKQLLEQRQLARRNQEWAESDRIRLVLAEQFGIEVKDTAEGQTWKKS